MFIVDYSLQMMTSVGDGKKLRKTYSTRYHGVLKIVTF